jgi:SulP family sulfate permease
LSFAAGADQNDDRVRPRLFAYFQGYNGSAFLRDLLAGITVAIVALPLAIGFGIASGVTPAQGLWTAIIGGFLISAFGGSRVQIGGPTGAFVPIIAGIVAAQGYGGLAVATLLAGVMLIGMGALRLGALIKYIPYPVIAGFTSGIAVIIFIGQLRELLGLRVALPVNALQQVGVFAVHLQATQWQAVAVGMATIATMVFWPRRWRAVPPAIFAVIGLTIVAHKLAFPIETIGTRFGGIPQGFPGVHIPLVSFAHVQALMLPAFTIAMLGAIESLLSAMVADGMIGSRHDSNQELIGQGLANLVSPLCGGIAATGAIARTATNVRSGGRTPVAGMVHSVTLLLIVLVAAPLARFIPLATFSGVLMVIAWRMGEWHNFGIMARGPRGDFWVLLVTFALTVTFGLTVAVGLGLLIAAALFVRQMEAVTQIQMVTAESDFEVGGESVRGKDIPAGVLIYRFEGPLFFGVAEKLEAALERSSATPPVVIFRMRNVPVIDATGLRVLNLVREKFERRGTRMIFSGMQPQPMKVLFEGGFIDAVGLENICANIDAALGRAREMLKDSSA